MVQLTNPAGKFVRRRYSVRDVDESVDQFTLWITTAHDGPGSAWARSAQPGDDVDIVGPRGQDRARSRRRLAPLRRRHHRPRRRSTEWPRASRRRASAIFIVEIDDADDALTATLRRGHRRHRHLRRPQGRERKDDPAGLLSGLAAFAFPPDRGHAYLFGEFHVMRACASRCSTVDSRTSQISVKAFWRVGRSNADHGEPDKSDD